MSRAKLIKAGDPALRLGVTGRPPLVDCRVVAEDEYQHIMALLESASGLIDPEMGQACALWQRDYQHWKDS